MKKILVLHGPNLNRLGSRETSIYGSTPLAALDAALAEQAKASDCQLNTFQSNSECALIEAIHQAADDKVDYIIINPAAFTHTSIALRDALLSASIPFYEVHISNIFAREPFRHHSYLSDSAQAVISGFGVQGYSLCLHAILKNDVTN